MTVDEKQTFLKSAKDCHTSNEIDYKMFLNNLKTGKDIKHSLLCLFEVLRSNPKVISLKDKDKIINSLVTLMKSETIDIKKFLEEEVYTNFNIEKYKRQFIGLIKTVDPTNKNSLHKILGKLIDASKDKNDIIRRLLIEIPKDKSYNDVFLFTRKSYDEIINQELENLDDKEYVNVFCELKLPNKHIPRKINVQKTKSSISGNEKYKYVKKAIETGFINEIIPFYFNDKEVKIRQLLSGSKFANNSSIISRFLNDHNSSVRCNILENLEIEDVIKMNLDVFDRVMDVDDSVRQKAFMLYDTFFNYIRSHHCISYLPNTEKNNTNVNENSIILSTVSYALLNLFKGINTIYRNEYVDYISKLNLSIDFYVEHYKDPGVKVYLEINRGNVFKNYNYKDLNEKQRSIFFLYHNEVLTDNEIKDLIKDDLMAAMFYLRNKEIANYIFEIYEKIVENDFPLQFKILTLEVLAKYKDILIHRLQNPQKDLVIASYLYDEVDLDTSVNTFDTIFYLAKSGRLEINQFKKCILSNCELIEVLIVSKNLDMLSFMTDRLLEDIEKFKDIFNERMSMNKNILGTSLNEFITENKHNMYLYILLFGNIKSSCIEFFISFLHFLASSTRNKDKLTKFYKKYISNVSKGVYNEFASVCYNLKTKSMYPADEQEYNVIREKDEVLYYIICIVLNHNVYMVNEKKYDLDLFYDVIEENLSLVLSKY